MQFSQETMGSLIFVLFSISVVSYLLYKRKKAKEKEAKQKAEQDAIWASSYANPSSPNYDAERVAAEWAQDPTNPDSPNYDPNV